MVCMSTSSNLFSPVKTPDIGGGKVNDTKEGENNLTSKHWVVNVRYRRGGTRSPPPQYRNEIRTNRSSQGNHVASDEKQGGLLYSFLSPRFLYIWPFWPDFLFVFDQFFSSCFWHAFLPRWWRRRRTRRPTRRSALRWRGSWISNPLFPVEITMSRDVKIVFRVQTVLLQHPLCEWISLISAPLRLKMRFCC